MQISPEYLAGFWDGEGCFYMGLQKAKHPDNPKLYPKAQVLLSQSGDDGLKLLEAIQAQYGGSIYTHLKPGQHRAKKTAYKIWWNKGEAIQLIHILLPYLILKKTEAETVLQYLTRE
jgi:hypothetical protein